MFPSATDFGKSIIRYVSVETEFFGATNGLPSTECGYSSPPGLALDTRTLILSLNYALLIMYFSEINTSLSVEVPRRLLNKVTEFFEDFELEKLLKSDGMPYGFLD